MTDPFDDLRSALEDRYAIEREIGRGGMATVFLAEDVRHSRKVAVKVLKSELAESVGADRFLQEIRTTANLRHPHIVPLYDSGQAAGFLYYVMPFVEGESLEQRLERERQLSVEETLKIASQVADALSYAHERGLLHRDIKPGNVMLERGHAVVTDFGVARAVFAAGGDRLTSSGLAVGTPAYMSPEQASGDDRLDARSDLYSLACVVYEMLAGQPPFTGMTASVVMARHSLDPVPPLATVRPGLSGHVARTVERALAKTPADRFPSTAEWARALATGPAPESTRPFPGADVALSAAPPTRPTELGIAVLPFEYASADEALASLSSGLSEDIATGLARFSYLSVNDSGMGDSPASLGTDPRETVRRLGVRYLLTGSLRRSGDLLRLNVRVVDAIAGQRVWAKQYDRDLAVASVFDVQDDLTDRIVATVADSYGVLVRSMATVLEGVPGERFDPADWVVQLYGYRQRITPHEAAEVRAGLEEAVRSHPHSSDLWACLAQIYLDEQVFGFNPGPDTLDRALTAARRSVDIDRSSQLGFQMLAQAHFFRRDLAAFAPASERAMELNPRDSNTLAILGLLIVHTGEFDRGAEIIRHAMEINPHHAGWYHYGPLWKHFHDGDYEKALSEANQVNMPELFWQYLAVASICGHLGRAREAKVAVRELLRVDPDFTTHGRQNIENWHFASGLLEPLLEGLRKAGLEVDGPPPADSVAPDRHSGPAAADDAPAVKSAPDSRSGRSDMAIAVLPMRGANDPELASMAEALTEDVTAGLTRFTYLDVVSGGDQSAHDTDPRLVASDLGARYVLTGRIRRAGQTVRVGVKLIDAVSGSHLWAESYDASLEASSLFDVQDDLVDRIVATVADQQGVLIREIIASVRDKPLERLSARDAVFLTFDYMQVITPDVHFRVREALERVVEAEPGSADAWACLSIMYCEEYKHDYNVRPDPLGRALAAGRRAADIDKTCQHAYYALAQAHFFRRDFGRFRSAAERAVQINPRDGNTVAFMGILMGYAGDTAAGVELTRQAFELNPHHPGWYRFGIFYDHYVREEYEEALAVLQAINMPGYWPTHVAIAAVAGHLGQLDVARDAVRELLVVYPAFAERGRTEQGKWIPDEAVLDRYFLGLRAAGLEVADSGLGTVDAGPEASKTGAAPIDAETVPSIAVVPFADMSPSGDQEYFCDGVCEEILNALARVKGLRVSSRISSFSFKGSNSDTRTVGEKLGVTNLLEGSVRKAGDRLRITAQLIAVDTDDHLWSETYDRNLDDVFAIQEDIAHSIVQALQVALSPGESEVLGAAPTAHAQAYDFYLRGREYFYRSSRRDHEFARQMFQRAIDIDPSFTRAYAGLADTICFVAKHFEHTDVLLAEADAASQRALDLDPGSAEAHTSRGVAHWLHKRYEEADREFDTAIALDPDLFEAYWMYGLSCFNRGKYQEAAGLLEKAEEVRPEDFQAPLVAAPLYQVLGREADAREASLRGIELARRHLELNPDDARAWYLGAGGLVKIGQVEEGLEWADRAAKMDPENPLVFYNLAEIYSSAGRLETAVDHLERSVALGYPHKEGIRNDPDFAALQGHSRYEAVVESL